MTANSEGPTVPGEAFEITPTPSQEQEMNTPEITPTPPVRRY